MAEYISNVDLPAAIEFLTQCPKVQVLTHVKPDGDAIGSVIALVRTLKRSGIAAEGLLVPPIPGGLKSLAGFGDTRLFEAGRDTEPADGVVLLDTGAWSQLGAAAELIRRAEPRLLIIDHHLGGDVPARRRYIDGHAAATAEIIADLLALWPIREGDVFDDEAVREAVFTGIASDTGWFRFSNTRARTHELAAMLIRRGLDQASLYQRTEQSERVEKLSLMVRSLHSLELLASGRAAIMSLRASDFEQTGASVEETDRFVDLPRMVDTVEVAILAVESPMPKAESGTNGSDDALPEIRLSLRSKAGPNAVNVATLAAKFHGGGHARAAGARLRCTLDEALDQLRKALLELLEA